jgi:hypothetical protein
VTTATDIVAALVDDAADRARKRSQRTEIDLADGSAGDKLPGWLVGLDNYALQCILERVASDRSVPAALVHGLLVELVDAAIRIEELEAPPERIAGAP